MAHPAPQPPRVSPRRARPSSPFRKQPVRAATRRRARFSQKWQPPSLRPTNPWRLPLHQHPAKRVHPSSLPPGLRPLRGQLLQKLQLQKQRLQKQRLRRTMRHKNQWCVYSQQPSNRFPGRKPHQPPPAQRIAPHHLLRARFPSNPHPLHRNPATPHPSEGLLPTMHHGR